jgi:hypothetical protein
MNLLIFLILSDDNLFVILMPILIKIKFLISKPIATSHLLCLIHFQVNSLEDSMLHHHKVIQMLKGSFYLFKVF